MNTRVLYINACGIAAVPGMLASGDYTVDAAADADEALRLVNRRDYGLIVLAAGSAVPAWELCGRLRCITGIPLVVVSANASAETCVKTINAGADYFMRKPFGPRELLARCDSLVQRAVPRQAAPFAG